MATHRIHYLHKMGLDIKKSYSLKELSKISGVPEKILDEVAERGAGAWSTNLASVRLKKDFTKNPDTSKYPRSTRLTQNEWKIARVYSFLDKGTTYKTTDSDLARKANY